MKGLRDRERPLGLEWNSNENFIDSVLCTKKLGHITEPFLPVTIIDENVLFMCKYSEGIKGLV